MRRSTRAARLPGVSTFRPQPTIPAYIDSALVTPRSTLHGSAAVKQMADDLRIAAQSGPGLSESEMRTLGWSSAQIASHSADAIAMADALRGAA